MLKTSFIQFVLTKYREPTISLHFCIFSSFYVSGPLALYIFNPVAELIIPVEPKSKMGIAPVFVETKIRKCSKL